MPKSVQTLKKFSHVLTVIAAMTALSVTINAQEGQYDHGTPPQHAAGVSPLGSYTSSDLGTINLSNGSLNIKLPLATIGGRGFSIPLSLNYSSKVWSASRESNFADQNGNHPVAYAAYADVENLMDIYSRVAPGWTIGAVPTLVVRGSGIGNNVSTCTGDFNHALTRLTVILPDKGEIPLRDDVSNGAPLAAQQISGCFVNDGNRGSRWHASDGSGLVFISDTGADVTRGNLNGVLVTADGTRYRFSSNTSYGGSVDTTKTLARAVSVTDRNGNVIALSYPNGSEVDYTDQLGRVTKIQKNVADPGNPSVTLALLVTIPGYQGQTRYFKVKTLLMNQRYRSGITPTLPVINGDYDPLGWGLSWGTATRLFARSHGLDAQRIDNQSVLSEFVLPDGSSLQFFYNTFGEVAEVQMPTGGKVQYDYQYKSSLPAGKSLPGEIATSTFDSNVSDIERAVIARRTYSDGVTKDGDWSYNYTVSTAQVIATSAAGEVLLNQKHYFLTSGRNLFAGPGTGPIPDRGVDGSGYNLWSTGLEYRVETLNAAGSTVIAASEQDWTQRAAVNWSGLTTYAQYQPENDNRVNEERKILEDLKTSRVAYLYDSFNNTTQTSEYDFDNTLKRRTTTSYSSTNLVNGVNYASDSIRLIRLPLQQSIYDATDEQARTIYEYDIYTGDGNHDYLLTYGSISGHDTANYGLTKTTRGNATRVGNWIKSANAYVYAYPRYDLAGNVVSTKDPNGNITTISFADDFGPGQSPGSPTQNPTTPTYALPTLITSPPPLPGAPVHTSSSEYDYSTGLLTGFRDRNNVVTQTFYNDSFNRPTLIKSALGVTGAESHTAMYYAPATVFGITLAKNDVLTASDLITLDDASIRSWTVTDGFGRTKETWSRSPEGDVKAVTIYDALGRVKQVSNPFRESLGETAVYTTTSYDLLGRITGVTTPDSATVTTSYSSNSVTVTDQAGKARKSVTDALGRMTDVYEDPAGLNYQTSCAYDVLDNLVKVTQGTQQRFFMFDSLKRLIRARNPEESTNASLNLTDPVTSNSAWSTGYQYDSNGNLTQKTDARGVVSTYVYDALNRNTSIDYSDSTPDVLRQYDLAINGKGRINQVWQAGTTASATYVDSYDALGRPRIQRQRFETNGVWSASYQTERAYNLAGSVTSQTYPSGRTVTYSYDSARRTQSVTGNLGDGVSRSYASTFVYNARSQVTQELFGTQTPLYHKLQYNIRGQLWDIRVSTGSDINGSFNRGALQFFYDGTLGYGTSGPDNNGNLLFANIYTLLDEQGNGWAIHRQSYNYDSLNRLKSVTEYFVSNSQPQSQQSIQSYTYDRWGNRLIDTAITYGTGINNRSFDKEDATNRLYAPGDLPLADSSRRIRYDAAGNQIKDTYTGFGTATFDAENRIVAIQDNLASSSYYTYNAAGQRVRRNIGNQETWQIYGIEGELLAEYAANGAVTSPQKEYGYRNGELLITAQANAGSATSGLVGLWKFDENTGTTAADSSGNSNTGSLTSGATWNTGQSGSAINLDGVDDYVQVGAKTSLVMSSAGSFSAWIYPTGAGSLATYGGIIVNKEGEYEIARFTDGTIQWAFANTNPGWNWINTGYVAPLNQWTHVAVTYDNGVIKTYINGVLTHTYTGSGVIGDVDASQNDFRIGGRQVTSQNFQGRIDEVRVYNRALSASEVAALPNSVGSSSAQINWLVTDHLGTPRIILDQTGSFANLKRHDYLPFGEELFAPAGGRSAALGYSAGDGVRQQFTSKERDNETGLDYFGARYYASTQGRFKSVDPSQKSIKATNPQTWNHYNYSLNNPLRYVDENGKWPTDTHNRIIEKAFRSLDPRLVRHIQRGSESVDRLGASPRTLYEKNAAQHAMTPGYKVRELGVEKARDWARNEATNFINTNMGQAKDLYEKSNQTNNEASKLILTVGAFEAFGRGAHTIMDGASPAHRDFQVYDTENYKLMGLISPVVGAIAFAVDMNDHANIEAGQPTDAEMNQMVDDLRMQFLNAFGREAYERAVPEEDRKATEERKRKQAQ